ncbi:MAG: caspase family protein, partial [Acidobacteria bacterium]|nr:caspase family protein [Acidobacteriota bacterium]
MNHKITILLSLFLFFSCLSRQNVACAQGHDTRKRLALVIGNNTYTHLETLANPVNDARAMRDSLTDSGFQVLLRLNLDREKMEEAVAEFMEKIAQGDVALFYYSGHGMEIAGENYLLPVDFDAKNSTEAKYHSLPANQILDALADKGATLKILILDACRNNPFISAKGFGRAGLATMSGPRGTLIAYAAAPGETASDNPRAANSLYTEQLLRAIRQPGLSLEQVFKDTAIGVVEASDERQSPFISTSVIEIFYFRPVRSQQRPETTAAPVGPLREKWALVVGIGRFTNSQIPALRYASKDAIDFAKVLTDPQIGKFPSAHVRVLLDSRATFNELRRQLNWLARTAGPDDLVVIYLASHGSPRSMDLAAESYFLPTDVDLSDQDSLYATGISMSEFSNFVRSRLKAQRLMLLVDTSHAGAITLGQFVSTVNEPVTLLRERTRVVITSCNTEENSYESEKFQNGYFIHFLIEALRKTRGMISAADLYNSVRTSVSESVTKD